MPKAQVKYTTDFSFHVSGEINILNQQRQLQSPRWSMQLVSSGVPEKWQFIKGEMRRTSLRPDESEYRQLGKEKKGA